MKQKNMIFEHGSILVFIAGCLWGSIGLFIRLISDAGASAITISFLRMAFAFVIMLVVTLIRSGISVFRVSKRILFFSAMLGLICHGVYNIFYSWAVVRIGVTVSAVLLNVAPVFTAILSAIFFHERITSYKCIALLINVIGCVLAATGGQFTASSLSVSGIFFGVVSGFCYALTAIFGKLVGEDSDPFVISTYSYLFAALFLAVFMRQWETPITFTIHIMWLGFLYALIPTAIGYLFYYQGVRQIHESSRVPVIASMETVMATVLGMLVLGEKLTVTRYLGIIIVMFSIVLMQQRKIVPDATAQNNSAM